LRNSGAIHRGLLSDGKVTLISMARTRTPGERRQQLQRKLTLFTYVV
jgi:hypothetical protein